MILNLIFYKDEAGNIVLYHEDSLKGQDFTIKIDWFERVKVIEEDGDIPIQLHRFLNAFLEERKIRDQR